MVKPTPKIRKSADWLNAALGANSQNNVLILLLVSSFLFINCLGKYVDGGDVFDNFVFSQRWLPSSCTAFEEKNPSFTHECVLPNKYQYWAIHGLWPNKANHHIGPFFCNKTATFRADMLEPIQSELRHYWPNIEKGKSLRSLWKHEWEKHGTCSMTVPELNSEFKYFNSTLDLYKKNNMNDLLSKFKILPSDSFGYNVKDMLHAVKQKTGTVPHISCITEKTTGRPYVSEIRLCLDKKLNYINCEGVIRRESKDERPGFSSHLLTNCPTDQEVFLPIKAYSPYNLRKKREARERYEKLIFLLQVIRFLM